MENEKLVQLQELALPEAVSYMPQTLAWYIVFGLLLLLAGWQAWRWYKRRKANRYRRAALSELFLLEQQF